jgi:hypothetical protein
MFCPKCGRQNPEEGKFCRSCGTDLGNVSQALSGPAPKPLLDHKGRPVSWERAIGKIFGGLAFLAVSIALAFSQSGHGWWFWLLIPAFMSLGAGFAQMVKLRNAESGNVGISSGRSPISGYQGAALPPQQTEWVSPPESRYKTGDLVPPSVAEGTTRHLEIDSEGQTMSPPKK